MASEALIGDISTFAGNFAPRGWAFCQGQILAIASNTALFSILGTTYGGNGQTTFALPNLQGRVPLGFGTGAGLSPYSLGEQAGSPTVTLLSTEMPQHTHTMRAVTVNGDTNTVSGSQLAKGFKGSLASGANAKYYSAQAPATNMSPFATSIAGGSQPHENMMPYLAINFIICMQGVFPARN